jgi:YesN/AraC family two-component response regulator
MENALELLKRTNYKIYEIAELTGYPNTEHFSRTFKKIMGQSPKEYR